MSLTTKQEHVTTTCALCMISKWHNNIDFALPRLGLASSLVCLASASSSLPLPLPCLASVKNIAALPRLCLDLPLPRQNCLEPIPGYMERKNGFNLHVNFELCTRNGNIAKITGKFEALYLHHLHYSIIVCMWAVWAWPLKLYCCHMSVSFLVLQCYCEVW